MGEKQLLYDLHFYLQSYLWEATLLPPVETEVGKTGLWVEGSNTPLKPCSGLLLFWQDYEDAAKITQAFNYLLLAKIF